MALVVCVSGEEKARKSSFRADYKKPWMLKDYLGGDDMSSCSSNGFRSFPRRQCCAAVIRNNSHVKQPQPKRMFLRNRSYSSALRRASMAVINVVKLLPFNSPAKSSANSGESKRLLSRNFSKKLFRRSFFWKKEKNDVVDNVIVKNKKKMKVDHVDEIERWISSGVVGKEKYQPLDLSNDTTITINASTRSISNSDGKSDSSWSDITFTSDSSENDVVERREKIQEVVSKRVGVIVGGGIEDSVKPVVAKVRRWFFCFYSLLLNTFCLRVRYFCIAFLAVDLAFCFV